MNLHKSSLCFVGIAALILSCGAAAAASVSDGINDIWHWTQTETAWSWKGNIAEKPNIDITEVSFDVSGNTLTLTLEVKGTIQSSEKIFYYIFYNSTDTTYTLVWSGGHGYGWAIKENSYEQHENITVIEDKIRAEFKVLGDTTQQDLWGYAVEYTSQENQTEHDYWGDWAPNNKFTGVVIPDGETNNTNDTNGNNQQQPNTPGFEAVAIITALCIIMILVRRNR